MENIDYTQPIPVDWQGMSADGNEYCYRAAPHMVKAGLMRDVPVLLKYPDGRLKKGNLVLMSPKMVDIVKAGIENEKKPRH